MPMLRMLGRVKRAPSTVSSFVDVGRVGRSLTHTGEIHMAYRGQRCFPPAVGTEPAYPSILVCCEGGIQAGGAHRFEQSRWCVDSL